MYVFVLNTKHAYYLKHISVNTFFNYYEFLSCFSSNLFHLIICTIANTSNHVYIRNENKK